MRLVVCWSLLLIGAAAIQFTEYQQTEQYKCGAFAEDRNARKTDAVLTFYYENVDWLVSWLSSPFPHEDLLSKKALQGDIGELHDSFETKYWQWIDWQKGWIGMSIAILSISVFFVLFFTLYKICSCFCSKSSKKHSTDARFDGCKRNIFNIILFLLVFVNVFVAFTLMMSSQYGQVGLDKLPSRINQCVDDLNVYKRDNDMRIRKLLIDDYHTLNRTITDQLANAGHSVVERVKRMTGANVIDIFLNVSSVATELQEGMQEVSGKIRFLNDESARFESEFNRLRKTANEELVQCVDAEMEPLKSMCTNAERLLESLAVSKFKIDQNLLSPSTEEALARIVDANITRILSESNSQFAMIETRIQHEIDKQAYAAHNMLKQIGDDLFVVAETISNQIRQVNLDNVYNSVSQLSDPKTSPTMKYIQYSWYASLVISSVFILLALCFLFGILYGICGRRPTYYNDDCCVRSTGGRFFSCGIWIFLVLFLALAVATTVLMFVMGNVTNVVCLPLRSPLSRPDILSFAERYVDIWKESHASTEKNDMQELIEKRSPADIIRACARNETLYEIFEFDKKYHLNHLKDFEKESYMELEGFLNKTMHNIPEMRPLEAFISKSELAELEKLANMNVTKVSETALKAIRHAMDELDLVTKTREFEEGLDNISGRPKAVTLVLEQVRELEADFAKPLRMRLDALYSNISSFDQRISQLQLPVSSLLVKLQHAQALLSENMMDHFAQASKDELGQMMANMNEYIEYVKEKMKTEVTSCKPLSKISYYSTAALCSYTIDPFNGAWMCMLLSLLLLIPITIISNALIYLYSKMYSFPKYIVEPPSDVHHPMSSFITDTYDIRPKTNYGNFSYTDDYQRTYR